MSEYSELLQSLLQEEEELQFTEFTNDLALQIGLFIIEKVKQENKHITLDISRNGQQLFHYAFPKTSADNDDWVQRKSRVAVRFGHSSHYVGTYLRSIQKNIQERYFLNPSDYSPSGGAFPIIVKDVGVVGAIAASGLTQEEDHALVVSAIRHFLNGNGE
ncbi:heme-degrading domain-containing protein [Paenibacillus thalictri]|uniref:UPF0303 protein EYB31_12465 n=1 Tax=Paenibacillus thalictri TaxID=2527873 RepID=A0A4V2J4B8_9BACL|nr:heme-degrading domain-containing protein [Paenibacillus thalictri]TBL79032.1 heme-degrading domain-containing protein [Paenibacillus thalictri]